MELLKRHYLIAYAGQPCEFKLRSEKENHPEYGYVTEIPTTGAEWGMFDKKERLMYWATEKDIKLVLRDISDLKIEEVREAYRFEFGAYPKETQDAVEAFEQVDCWLPETTMYMISIGIDIFELVKNGIAVNNK